MTQNEAAARDGLAPELRDTFDALVADYRFICDVRYRRAWVNYQVLAELVVRGWKPARVLDSGEDANK